MLVQVKRVTYTYAFPQNMLLVSSTLGKPYMILGVFYFLFRQVNLAEYIPVLMVYSLLLQMTCYIRASARIASTRRG
jgi:hypothetical protein